MMQFISISMRQESYTGYNAQLTQAYEKEIQKRYTKITEIDASMKTESIRMKSAKNILAWLKNIKFNKWENMSSCSYIFSGRTAMTYNEVIRVDFQSKQKRFIPSFPSMPGEWFQNDRALCSISLSPR